MTMPIVSGTLLAFITKDGPLLPEEHTDEELKTKTEKTKRMIASLQEYLLLLGEENKKRGILMRILTNNSSDADGLIL